MFLFDLFRVVVAGGVAVGDLAEGSVPPVMNSILSEGGLAASAVAKQHDIANVFFALIGFMSSFQIGIPLRKSLQQLNYIIFFRQYNYCNF